MGVTVTSLSPGNGKEFPQVGDTVKIHCVPQLSLGEKALLVITPDYGYGARGYPPVIPPNAELRFEVELLQIIKK
ncbi:FK506 binding protein proline rotamase rapamycin-binding protein [Modicella reniformis]|uniref:peptidylprolyl isomerase n=1 Tax=Modicella reniformis TaxID=1440133 RepID=A0A9P6ITF7_9FUNG|nr:FK506 binding protein proline rotamase rapamycin-binding protein [Modicella reniformis]